MRFAQGTPNGIVAIDLIVVVGQRAAGFGVVAEGVIELAFVERDGCAALFCFRWWLRGV